MLELFLGGLVIAVAFMVAPVIVYGAMALVALIFGGWR